MSRVGTWAERLDAIAVGREVIAVAGKRDAVGVATSAVHVFPLSLLDDKGASVALDAGAPVAALAFAGDGLLLSGGADGRVLAWDVAGQRIVGQLALSAPVRAIAVDPDVARGDRGVLAVATADGALHVVSFAQTGGPPALAVTAKHTLSDGPVNCVAHDPAGLWLAGAADGQLWVVGATNRAISPGGDGGIRAVAAVGDGRAVVGCGDGSIRACFVVGDVEPTDRSGDHGHGAAVRALVLGPLIVDDAGREQPRRMFSAGEDGVIKQWFVDGARRPKAIEPNVGPLTALVFAPGPVAKVEKAAGRLWLASANRSAGAYTVAADLELSNLRTIGSIFDALGAPLSSGSAAAKVKIEAINKLETLAEDEARVLLDLALGKAAPEVQIAAAQAIARSQRRSSRPAVRVALGAPQPELRAAAFAALVALEKDQPLAAIRAALAARHEDVRALAVAALVPHAASSVVAAGMIADVLRDAHPDVRRHAYIALRKVSSSPLDAIRTALQRGTPEIRGTALLDLGFVVRAKDAAARALAAEAFDDPDATVRGSAFLAAIMQRERLAARLYMSVPTVHQAFDNIPKQFGVELNLPAAPDGALDDDELEPLFTQLACRSGDAAIRGAGALLALRDPRAVGAVLQLTREADPSLRRVATGNLVTAIELWPDDDRIAARLSWLLDDSDADVRAYAFDALAKPAAAAGPAAELALATTTLRTSQEDIRVRALQILVRVGAPGSAMAGQADALLGDALDDEASKVRSEAFRTLWAWHTADPLTALARGAQSRHADLRTQVIDEIDRRRKFGHSSPALDALLLKLVGDPVAQVGLAAYAALTRPADDGTDAVVSAAVHLAALASPAPAVRAAGAKGAHKASAAQLRQPLSKLVKDDQPVVQLAAIEALDAVAPDDAEGFALAWASPYWDIQVRAGELVGARRDTRAVAPMTRILTSPKTDANRPPDGIRQRAARALADVGDVEALPFLRSLIEDEDPIVREMAARGIATAARPGHTPSLQALLALLGHADLPVRSWGGEGLAKLGDLRALPVLAGTQRHEHRPLRMGAILGFVALGPEGVRGLRQGLEDRDREIQDLVFSVIVARDAALASAGVPPDLLVDAMSSPNPEIRFAAARIFERRAEGGAMTADVIGDIVGPRKPDKAADMKDWPAAPRRASLLQVLADTIASDQPAQRYAAAQVLAVRSQPLTFWKEAARLAGPARGGAPAPLTSWSTEARVARRSGWLRRLVSDRRDPEASELESLALLFLQAGAERPVDAESAHRLVFGVYAGLVRQAPARGDADETHRVRRDSVGRLVELAREDAVGVDAVLPVLAHAVSDPHHLVRQAAMSALRSLYPVGALAPLQRAIAGAADLGKPAVDELVALAIDGDDRASALVRAALDADDADVRAYAALRLAKLYPSGSAEPQLVAARSKHGDVRLAAITQLATSSDGNPAIVDALVAALASEHADLRLAAAVALARKGNALGVDVLAGFLRSDDQADDALRSLVGLADKPESASAAATAIAARLEDDPERTANRHELFSAFRSLGHPTAAPTIVRFLVEIPTGQEADVERDVAVALEALKAVLRDRTKKPRTLPSGQTRHRYTEDVALPHLEAAARSPLVVVRQAVAGTLGDIDDPRAEVALERLLGDRDALVRVAAAESLALRAEYVPGATLSALESALRGGRRELVLPAAMGLAARRKPEAFQPLLLVAKAGELPERERALLALGSLGDRRALEHLDALRSPEPDDEIAQVLSPVATEALGRLLPSLAGDEAAEIRERLERLALAGSGAQQQRALTGLRYAGQLDIVERVAADPDARVDARVHAIRELELAASASSEAVLAELLNASEWNIREAAMTALTKVLAGDRTKVSFHALGAYWELAQKAAAYLATAGDAAILVEKFSTLENDDVRRRLRDGLIRRGELPQAALDRALRSSDVRARTEAAWITGAGADAARGLSDAVIASVKASDVPAGQPHLRASAESAWEASLWAARRTGVAGNSVVIDRAQAALKDDKLATKVRRQAASVMAEAGNAQVLSTLVGDADRDVRAIASAAVATLSPTQAAVLVREQGGRADATTIQPLALAAWSELARDSLADPATRSWASVVSLAGRRVADLVAIARTKAHAGRLAAIGALGHLGGDEAKQVLEAIHADKSEDDSVRLAAWKALKRVLRREEKVFAEDQDKPLRGEDGGGGGDDDGDGDGDDSDDDAGGDDDEETSFRGVSDDDDDGDDDDFDEDEDEDEDEEDDE